MDERICRTGALVLAVALVAVLAALPAAADEIWVAPAEKSDHEVGDWGVTNTGEAHFSFAVPEQLDSLTAVEVVLLGKKNRQLSYDVSVSIAQDGQAHDTFTSGATGLPLSLSEGDLAVVDVTSIFPAALAAGDDLVSVSFQASPNGQAHVVGLRLRFEAVNPLAGNGCADDELLRGYDSAGDPICVAENDVLGVLDCPDGELFVSFDESTGSPVCVSEDDILAALDCPDGQAVTGWDESTGEAECATGPELMAGFTCVDGEVIQGFAADGSLICVEAGGDSGGGGGGGGGTGSPTLSIDSATVIEGDSGTTSVTLTVSVFPVSTGAITVDYATADDTATAADNDYVAASGTLSFTPLQAFQTFTVDVNGDTQVEANEQFFVDLSNASGATIGVARAIVGITDDDQNVGR